MELQFPFRVVTPTLDGDILTVLARAEAEFAISDLRRLIGKGSVEGLRRALDRLTRQGVVTRRRIGTTNTYHLNRDHLAAPAILALADQPTALRTRIAAQIREWPEQPIFVGIFGSAAQQRMNHDSDIDIVLVHEGAATPAWDEQIDSLSQSITAWTGNDARPLVYSADEIQGRADTEVVLRDIARDAIAIAGDRTRFAKLIETR